MSLTVSDPGAPPLRASASTTAAIVDVFESRVSTTNANRTIRLGSGKPEWCARIEPIGGNFNVGDLVSSALYLEYGDRRIPAASGKPSTIGDQDRNGVDEVDACFQKADLRVLFADLPAGRTTVPVTIRGELVNGARAVGGTQVEVVGSGAGVVASVAPNPLRRETTLTFSTSVPGRVRVSIFDLRGRLVRRLLDAGDLGAGYHDVRMGGPGESASGLASGVYFYRIEAREGTATGRFVVMK